MYRKTESTQSDVLSYVSKGPKLIVYKFRRRKNYRRKRGHRQHFTEVKITGIAG